MSRLEKVLEAICFIVWVCAVYLVCAQKDSFVDLGPDLRTTARCLICAGAAVVLLLLAGRRYLLYRQARAESRAGSCCGCPGQMFPAPVVATRKPRPMPKRGARGRFMPGPLPPPPFDPYGNSRDQK